MIDADLAKMSDVAATNLDAIASPDRKGLLRSPRAGRTIFSLWLVFACVKQVRGCTYKWMSRAGVMGWVTLLSLTGPLVASPLIELESRDGRKISVEVVAVNQDSVAIRKVDGKESTIAFTRLTESSVTRAKEAVQEREKKASVVSKPDAPVAAPEAATLASIFKADEKLKEATRLNKADETAAATKELQGLIARLEEGYQDLDLAGKCARSVAIAQGKLPGSGSGETEVGAAVYLGRLEGEPVVAALYETRRSGGVAGVELACNKALGRRCTGDFMKKVVTDFISEDKATKEEAGWILTDLATREQADELKSLAPMVTTEEAKDRWKAVFSLLRHLYY